MNKAFTIIEVSILLVIFLIVAFLVAPLSLDDTKQARNTSKWRSVQSDFSNIFYSLNTSENNNNSDFYENFIAVIKDDYKSEIPNYRITFKNGTYPSETYRFKKFYTTYSDAVLSVKLFENPDDDIRGILMYDVNGKKGPNTWGKDVFGYEIYEKGFEPFCKNKPVIEQKQDCSGDGSGLCCSNYYLIGGNLD